MLLNISYVCIFFQICINKYFLAVIYSYKVYQLSLYLNKLLKM